MNKIFYLPIGLTILTIYLIYKYYTHKVDIFSDYCVTNTCPPIKKTNKYIYCSNETCPPPSSGKCIC